MDYIPIRVGTIRPEDPIHFDVYIKISDRFVHYLRTADSIDLERIKSLKKKGVTKLFIKLAQQEAYLQYLDVGLEGLADAKKPELSKIELSNSVLSSQAENAKEIIQNKASFEQSSLQVEKVIGFITSNKTYAKKMLESSGVSSGIMEHSVNVATLAVSLAPELGITDSNSLLTIGMAALFHDIGRTEGMSELEKLEHPAKAHELLNGKAYISSEVIDLIMNHEEIGEGLGYPSKKSIKTLPMPSQILNLCNHYDHFCISKGLSHAEATKPYFKDCVGLFDLKLITTLSALLKKA